MRDLVLRTVPPSKSALVVDVGCGTGGNIAALAGEYKCVGTDPSTPPALLASPKLGSLVERAKQEFGLVLVDVPPVFPVADVALVAGVIKMFLLVVRAGVVSPQELDRAVHSIKQVGGEVLGVVLNAAEPSETYGYGYYHYRQYYKREKAAARE